MAAGARRPADAGQGAPLRVAVAVSGGVDSIALLHATCRWARDLGAQVHALHVHHGLQRDADAWARGVAVRCRRWGAVFHATRLSGRPARGDSIEAWARRERYAALATMAVDAGCGIVLLAHHARDQAETVLLQALRGAGPAGLAAMPRVARREGLTWARPWLRLPREAILAYARRHRLRGVQDPSNADSRHARGRLRIQVWPVLRRAFGDVEVVLQAVAQRAQEARAVLDELAVLDAATVVDGGALRVVPWLLLSEPRRANVLRHWLTRLGAPGAPETLVQRLLRELPASRDGSWPLGAHVLRLHRGRLMPVAAPEAGAVAVPPAPVTLDLSRVGRHHLPGAWGSVRVVRTRGGGVPLERLASVQVAARSGDDRFQSHPAGVPRSLKKQFQAAAVPRWERDGPVLHAGGQLLWVAGLGLDARALAWPGEPRVRLQWEREAAVSGREAAAD